MSLKGCQEWINSGFPLSTTSNEAAKMYDAIVQQLMYGYDVGEYGPISQCLEKMLSADPNFVLGYTVKHLLILLSNGTSTWSNAVLKADIDDMVKMAEHSDISLLEKLHVDAVKFLSMGYLKKACDKWDEILLFNPTDMQALSGHFTTCFQLGQPIKIRDTMASVSQYWKTSKSTEMYSIVKGWYSFGLEEAFMFPAAEKVAMEALGLNLNEAWSVHTIAHIRVMQGRPHKAIEFMENTEKDTKRNSLHGHIRWHLAISYIETGDYETALTIYDNEFSDQIHVNLMMLRGAVSILYHLQLEGVNVGDRWEKLYKASVPHIEDQALAFNDIHYLITAQATEHKDVADRLMDSIKNFVSDIKDESNDIVKVYRDVALPMCQAFQAYHHGDYCTAVDLLYPLRYQFIRIGCSHAQADTFNVFLLHSALKSSNRKHQLLAGSMLRERKAQQENNPLNERLLANIVATL